MSVLTNKRVLIIGKNQHLEAIASKLQEFSVEIVVKQCSDSTVASVSELKPHFVILDLLADDAACLSLLDALHTAKETRRIPIFALIANSETSIEKVLVHGAVDYIAADEPVSSVVQKICSVFGEDGVLSSDTIDITPKTTSVTRPGLRVFVIEDDPLLRNLLAAHLGKSSFVCEFSSDGLLPLQTLRKFLPDVIVLDLMLPGKSGFEVLADMKADPELQRVPVIVFSNRDSNEDRERAKDLGAASFYVKAMTDLSELVEIIQKTATVSSAV